MSAHLRRPYLMTAALALLTAVMSACNLEISNQAEAKDEWKRTYTLAPGGTLEIRNTNGLVDVQPSTGPAIEVVAERVVHAGTDQAAKDALNAFEIKETVSPSMVTLDSTPTITGFMRGSQEVRYHVKAPRTTNLRLSGTNGEITIADMAGSVDAKATNGDIKATGLTSAVVVETTNGDVNLAFTTLAEGGVSCDTTNGELTITLPRDVHARLTAHVGNGDIKTEGLTLVATENSAHQLNATLGGGGPLVTLGTTNGGIHVSSR